ncbi:MAG: hypothetical protein WC208_12365 [Gallionella sp.]|jgi:uncharacterized protein with HEPN domain
MLIGAMLGLMEQIGLDILTLTDSIDEDEFFASRLTRTETLRFLGCMTKNVGYLPFNIKVRMPEIDWASWAALGVALQQPSQHRLQIWVAIKELTPLTLQYLNDYKRTQPQLFSIVP